MTLWPKSRRARRRLTLVLVAAPILAAAAALSVMAMGEAVVFFYTPSQLTAERAAPGRAIKLGGLVRPGSVRRHADGTVDFVVTDGRQERQVVHQGDLPDLFREGQGVVAEGEFLSSGVFSASSVLAKHDERYMPRDVERTLRQQGVWRGGSAT